MKKIFKDILVAAAIGAVVGVLVSFAAPTIAAIAGTGAAGAMGSPVFMALFAGSWGAFGAAITPIVTFAANKFLGGKSLFKKDINTSSPMQTHEPVYAVPLEPELDLTRSGRFAEMIAAEKARSIELSR